MEKISNALAAPLISDVKEKETIVKKIRKDCFLSCVSPIYSKKIPLMKQ
ncbi:hypothetical protein [uncultured Dialister sp.]|nr:hypothetical protein [uncultured Dialister sp.]